ncbi:MAG TPA: hypothetical protein VIV15_14120 [Anaerolineales bacterium]
MLVFIHINKTAGSTVRYILRSTFGMNHCEVEPWHSRWGEPPFSSHDLQRLRKLYPHLESIAGHRVTGYVNLRENGTKFNYFTILRDPVRTCASRFQYNIQYRGKKDLVFEEWIQQDWTRNSQTRLIAGTADVDKAIRTIKEKGIFVALTERFDESMLLLKELVEPRLNISYQPVNKAASNTIAQELLANTNTHQMLVEANRLDQQLYDYAKREIYPAYQREYGVGLEADLADYQGNLSKDFNNRNLTLSRVKQYALYKPLLYLYRRSNALQRRADLS